MMFGLQPAVVGAAQFCKRSEFDHGISPLRKFVGQWITLGPDVINRNNGNSLFLKTSSSDDKASRFRSTGDFRKSRGIAVICGRRGGTGTVQGHRVQGGEPAAGAARRTIVQPHLAAARL